MFKFVLVLYCSKVLSFTQRIPTLTKHQFYTCFKDFPHHQINKTSIPYMFFQLSDSVKSYIFHNPNTPDLILSGLKSGPPRAYFWSIIKHCVKLLVTRVQTRQLWFILNDQLGKSLSVLLWRKSGSDHISSTINLATPKLEIITHT